MYYILGIVGMRGVPCQSSSYNTVMVIRFSYLLLLIMCLSGCRATISPVPEWVQDPWVVYPTTLYVVGLGEGSSRDQAERRAYEAVARVFVVEVEGAAVDEESYGFWQGGDGEGTNRRVYLQRRTKVTTKKVLHQVQLLESWFNPTTHQFAVLAGFERSRMEGLLADQMAALDHQIGQALQQGRKHGFKVERLQGYVRAFDLLNQRELLHRDLQVVRQSGQGNASPWLRSELTQEFSQFVKTEVAIQVIIEGDYGEELERAIWGTLQPYGLVKSLHFMSRAPNEFPADVVIEGTSRVWPLNLPDPMFYYVRWCVDVVLEGPAEQRVFGIISRSGREGHITHAEAKMRASRIMQKIVAEDVAKVLLASSAPLSSSSGVSSLSCSKKHS